MENKYFHPYIEDMHVGYEYERFVPKANATEEECWEKLIMSVNYLSLDDIDNEIIEKEIRVPYLTKEQIEAEGWEYVKNTNKVDVGICHIFDKNNYMLGWFPLINKIALLVRDPSKAFDKNGILVEYNNTERYTGSCKDINTFRKIIKLLNI